MRLVIHLLLLSAAIYIIARAVPGIRIKGFGTAIVVAIVYSIANYLLFWLLVLLTLPATILTFGLFIFVINGIILWLTDKLIDDFEISGFLTTVIAAFLITVLNYILRFIFSGGL